MVDLSPSFTSSSPMPKNQLAEVLYESVALSLYCAAVEWFFYGMNVVLFCFCIKTLRNCRLPHRRGLSVAVAVIFSFCSLHCVLSLVNDAQWMAHIFNPLDKALLIRWDKVNIVMDVLYQTNNLIADGIFIYRCYGIWNFSKRIIILPITLLISTALLGYAGIIVCAFEGLAGFLFATWLFPLAVIFSVLTNILLMGLAAGRIWWICRGARAIMGPAVVKRYRTVVAMILESGALYVTLGILYLIFLAVPSSTVSPTQFVQSFQR
ncbi:hypothetical protein B0H10DRAFT_1338878 [Mycena sp. CBHHK59/15]|nr:hypothetical protein B0H10DRAFT_1338878 [Mycena sp. CBHHK59/15]